MVAKMSCCKLVYDLKYVTSLTGINDELKTCLIKKVQTFKMKTVICLKDQSESGLLTILFHFLEHLYEYLKKVCIIWFLNAAHHEHFNISLKIAYWDSTVKRVTK